MTVNLSVDPPDGQGRGVEHFYTDLHSAMYNFGDIDDAPFPSAREFRKFITDEYPNGMDGLCCLDAGCGSTAINSRSLVAARAARVLALDSNHGGLQRVRQSLSERTNKTLSIACGSLLDMPLPAAMFDFVVCSGVVHHTPDPERALRELRRVVKPNGRVYVSVYCFEAGMMLSVVRFWRFVARIIPFRLAHALFRRSAVVNNFVLDHMYVPILWVYGAYDFLQLLQRCGFLVDGSFVSALDPFHQRRMGPSSLTGDGLLRVFLCTVPA